jgi:protease-4
MSDPQTTTSNGRNGRRRDAPRTSRAATWALVGLTVFSLGLFAGSIGVVAWLVNRSDGPEVHDGTWLVTRLEGEITDAPVQGGLFLEPDDFPLVVTDYARAIRSAATDERIEGLVLRLDEPSVGLGGYAEIRGAVEDFRAAGKPCVAYSEMYTTGSYYLASACDTVLIAPAGISLVSGLALSVTYYADTLAMLGMQAEYEHVGNFKSGPEPFQRTGPSEDAAVAYEALIDANWQHIVAKMAEGRGKTPEEIQAAINDLRLTPDEAIAAGLIDGVAFPDGLAMHIEEYGQDGWIASLAEPTPDLKDEEWDARFTTTRAMLVDDETHEKNVAVVFAEGTIVSGDGDGGLFGSVGLADGPFREWMEEAREDESVAAVVLRVNSPGGSGLASDMMWREIERTRAAGKPVVVSMADYAASGGYYISAPADHIVALPTTLTGSIGVFGGKLNLAGTYEKLGMHHHTFQRGDRADMLSAVRSFDEGERQVFRTYLETFYETFLARVAAGREMERDAVHEVAQGRVWTGEQALERGLVDEIGGLDVALAKAAELASLEDYGVVQLPKQKSFIDVLMEDLQQSRASLPVDAAVLATVPGGAEAVSEVLLVQDILADGAVVWLPGRPTFTP